MTQRVDFYLSQSDGPLHTQMFTARLIEKCYKYYQNGVVVVTDEANLSELDTWLWTHDKTSFIPHGIKGNLGEEHITLCQLKDEISSGKVLVNLTANVISEKLVLSFDRLLEIVHNDASALAASRRNYQAYRALTENIHIHEFEQKEATPA